MEYANTRYNKNVAYQKIEDKIKKSHSYYDFIWYITNLDNFREIFTFEDGKFNAAFAGEAIENLESLRFICNDETGLHEEKRLHDAFIESVKEDSAISTIINTYLIETKYGNPSRIELDDYTPNDKLFAILESVFGLDALILSVIDTKKLWERFNEITEDDGTYDMVNFNDVIEKLYELSKGDDTEAFTQAIENYSDYLRPYILAGINKQYTEISKTKHGSFEQCDNLREMVTKHVLRIEENKKM